MSLLDMVIEYLISFLSLKVEMTKRKRVTKQKEGTLLYSLMQASCLGIISNAGARLWGEWRHETKSQMQSDGLQVSDKEEAIVWVNLPSQMLYTHLSSICSAPKGICWPFETLKGCDSSFLSVQMLLAESSCSILPILTSFLCVFCSDIFPENFLKVL